MSHDDLVTALATLQRELEQADHLSDSDVEQLRATIDEIESVIVTKSEHHATLSERLAESAAQFEASHPILTMNLVRISDILQRMGF